MDRPSNGVPRCRADREAGLPARHRHRPARLHRGRSDPGERLGVLLRGHARPGRAAADRGLRRTQVRTDAAGQAIHRTTAVVEPRQEGPEIDTINVSPARAEEGEIAGASREFVVFPSSRTIASDAAISGGRVRVTGDVHVVDVAGLEADIAGGSSIWDLDPRGAPVRGATVTVRFIEQIPVRTRTGTEYDFIEKRVVPIYEDTDRGASRRRRPRQDRRRWLVSRPPIPASTADHDYQVVSSVGDPDGLVPRDELCESPPVGILGHRARGAHFRASRSDGAGPYGIGDRIDLTHDRSDRPAVRPRRHPLPVLRGAARPPLRDGPGLAPLRDDVPRWAAPNLGIGGSASPGHGYVEVGVRGPVPDAGPPACPWTSTSKAARYAPGDDGHRRCPDAGRSGSRGLGERRPARGRREAVHHGAAS